MGPDGVWIGAIVLAKSGINKEYLVHLAVVVPVIVGIVHIGVGQSACLFCHLLCIGIGVPVHVPTVIGHVLAQLIGTHHIEVYVQLAIALRPEIICHRTAHAVVGISFYIKEIVENGLGIRGDKVLVVETDKDYQPLFLSFDAAIYKFPHTAAGTVHTLCILLRPLCSGILLLGFQFALSKQAQRTIVQQTVSRSVLCFVIMKKLVTHQLQGNLRAVLPGKYLLSLIGRHGIGTLRQQGTKRQDCHPYSFSHTYIIDYYSLFPNRSKSCITMGSFHCCIPLFIVFLNVPDAKVHK